MKRLSPSRRDVLAAFLGSTALASCRRRPHRLDTPQVSGRLIDDLHLLGHRLRQPASLSVAPLFEQVDVAIVGAGVAGLSAGWRLAGAGVSSFVVLEVDTDLGGTAKCGRATVTAFPWGAHYLPAPLTAEGPVPRLLGELGILTGVDPSNRPTFAEEALVREPEERLFYRGRWYEGLYLRAGASADDLSQLERFEALCQGLARAVDGKGRKAFAVPLEAGSDDAEWTALDAQPIAQWLDAQGFTSPRLRWLVEYACRDDFGSSLATTSAWAALWYFCARQSGEERSDGYLTWPEGNAHLVSHLARATGEERIRRNTLVHSVSRTPTGWRLDGLQEVDATPVSIEARHVILATPRFVAARLVSSWRTSPPAFLGEFASSPWVVANLHLAHRPASRGAPLAWDNVAYDSKSLGYVVATHQLPRAEESGPTVLTWYYPLVGPKPKDERARLLETTWEDWKAIILADVVPAHLDLHSAVERIDVLRWGHAMVRPTPGFLWGKSRREAGEPLAGSLHFAHSDLGGLALFEEANWHGVRAAEAALRGLGSKPPSWL